MNLVTYWHSVNNPQQKESQKYDALTVIHKGNKCSRLIMLMCQNESSIAYVLFYYCVHIHIMHLSGKNTSLQLFSHGNYD